MSSAALSQRENLQSRTLLQQGPNDLSRKVAKKFCQSVRPFDANNSAKGMDVETSSTVRKLPSTNDRVTKEQTAERVSFALQAWGKGRASPIKAIQRLTGVNRKAAEAWWHGQNPPQSDHLLTLARAIPELKGEVRRLLCMEADLDPDFQRELSALIQRYIVR